MAIGPSNTKEVKIDASHCYRCDKPFSPGEHKKTKHHAIPKSMNPARNVLIPVCGKCHEEIHQAMMITPKLKEYDNFIKGIEDFVTKHKKKTSNLRE